MDKYKIVYKKMRSWVEESDPLRPVYRVLEDRLLVVADDLTV